MTRAPGEQVTMPDGSPRYKVSSVHGYAMSDQGRAASRRDASDFAVLDRAWCHRPVATFSAGHRTSGACERMARLVADELNAGRPLPWFDAKVGRWLTAARPEWHRLAFPAWPWL